MLMVQRFLLDCLKNGKLKSSDRIPSNWKGDILRQIYNFIKDFLSKIEFMEKRLWV
jgi:hypothetical protein